MQKKEILVLIEDMIQYNFERLKREVYCPKCGEYFIVSILIPLCTICDGLLINVVKSTITGEKITGGKDDQKDITL